MDHKIIKTVIYDRHEVIKNINLIDRDYSFDLNVNYVLTGLRRAGKTMMLYSIVQQLIKNGVEWNQIIYINFEDERLAEFNINDFNDIVEVKNEITENKAYYFFDEIQNIDGWELFARRLADEKEFVYITGSNSKMLSREISNQLGARYIPLQINTLSFDEYLNSFNVGHDEKDLYTSSLKGRLIRYFDDYYHFGGFPETLNINVKREYVSNIYNKIMIGDIATRNSIRNENALKLLVKKIAETVTDSVSYTRLYNILKQIGISSISKDTIIDYISYCKDAFLLFDIKNYFASFVEKESNPKYYFNDNGILNLFLIDKDPVLLENVVALFLYNRYDELYYLKSDEYNVDIDFYIPDNNSAVQVSYSLSVEARNREINNLINFEKSNGKCRKIIVTYQEEEIIEEDDYSIEVIPAYKFILGCY